MAGQPAPEGSGQVPVRVQSLLEQFQGLTAEEQAFLRQGDNPFTRALQSAKEQELAQARTGAAQQSWEQRRLQLEAEERQARETDPYKAAQLRDQLDGMTAQAQVIQGMARLWDQATLDPLLMALPEGERKTLQQAAASGLEGRLQLTKDALHRLEQHWRQDEARKLRANPAFRKELLNARRDAGAAELEEPELVTGTNGRARATSMNDWLRASLR